jgi:protein-S-isoprenylcysteine O-methyltransferase Ste14
MFPTDFVASGPIRYRRNPMSLGAVAVFVGLSLTEQSVSILFFSLLPFLTFHLLAVYVEEPGLEKRFGSAISTTNAR